MTWRFICLSIQGLLHNSQLKVPESLWGTTLLVQWTCSHFDRKHRTNTSHHLSLHGLGVLYIPCMPINPKASAWTPTKKYLKVFWGLKLCLVKMFLFMPVLQPLHTHCPTSGMISHMDTISPHGRPEDSSSLRIVTSPYIVLTTTQWKSVDFNSLHGSWYHILFYEQLKTLIPNLQCSITSLVQFFDGW